MLKPKSKQAIRSEISQIGKSTDSIAKDYEDNLDELIVKVKLLQVSDINEEYYNIDITYFDQTIIKSAIMGTPKWGSRSPSEICGTMSFDPSDYEKMSLFADYPLIVTASVKGTQSAGSLNINPSSFSKISDNTETLFKHYVSCCNVDIFSLFIDQETIVFEKRMEPAIEPSVLSRKSWDNLPLIVLEVSVKRNELNAHHHEILREANYMKMTVVGAYNILVASDPSFEYTLATKMPLYKEKHETFIFGEGYKTAQRFDNRSFRACWESMRSKNEDFTKADEKTIVDLEHVANDENIDLVKYFNNEETSIIWASFHRTLIFGDMIKWFNNYIRGHKWQLEIQLTGDCGGFGLFCPLSLFNLLYPGENKITLAVPLQFVMPESYEEYGFHTLLPSTERPVNIQATPKPSKLSQELSTKSISIDIRNTGADENNAFILVEIALYKPLKKIVLPPIIPQLEIEDMLENFEETTDVRVCTGRGYHKEWQNIVKIANDALRRVPYYGTRDMYGFSKQLSESRTRVELFTSFWQKATKYVNENFVLDRYIHSDDTYQELLIMAHACLMKDVEPALIEEPVVTINPILRAARHARQLQSFKYAKHLYIQVLVDHPNDGNVWRELATCYKDLDIDCAFVCMQRAMEINCTHPLTLLSMGCMIMNENVEAAEPFFVALLSLYPFHTTLWYCVYCYYIKRELFDIANVIMDLISQTKDEKLVQDLPYVRKWEHELGDWWDPTPMSPNTNVFYDVADLLLRIRGFTLADVCISQALIIEGETLVYRHLLALSCRLRGDIEQGLCHVRLGKMKFGQLNFLNSLEAECLYKLGDVSSSMAAYKRAGLGLGPYGLLLSRPTRVYPKSRTTLVDLVKSQPSAYAWMALANDWLQYAGNHEETENPEECAAACAVQALKYDRSFTQAWALLGKLVTVPERRNYCYKMDVVNCYCWHNEDDESKDITLTCCIDYKILRECRCNEVSSTECSSSNV